MREFDKKLSFNNEIRLENITFRYSSKTPIVLNSLSLTIKKGEKIGIIGETGCGNPWIEVFRWSQSERVPEDRWSGEAVVWRVEGELWDGHSP